MVKQEVEKLESWQLEYQGYFKYVNDEPDNYITVFCSDWNKDHWAFYVYIDVEDYENDIEAILDLISTDRLNFRDGDLYIELIDHSSQEITEKIYHKHYERGYMSHSSVLDINVWSEIIEEIQSEPPTFSSGWDALEYLLDMGYSKDYLFEVFSRWIGDRELNQIYERIMSETI